MPPRAKEHDHRVTHISQDEFLVILAFFFDKEVRFEFHAPRISTTVSTFVNNVEKLDYQS